MAFDWEKYGLTDFRTGGGLANTNHNIDRLYQATVGRNADSAGQDYWRKQLQSGANTYDTIRNTLTASDEYKDRLLMVQNNPNVQEADLDKLTSAYRSPFSAGSGSAVAGWQPGDPLTQATAEATKNNYVTPSSGGGNVSIQPVMGPQQPQPQQDSGRWDELFGAISGLQGQIGSYQNRLNDLQKAYDQQGLDMQNQWNNMMWDQNRPQNLSVRGVRTQNELPGWRPKTQGAGFFSRGGSGSGLTTSSINI